MTVRTRFAPSPTGLLHIGGVRTALFCWLYARRQGGQFVLRIEDTDRQRSTEEAIQIILDGMAWLGLSADEGPYFQTQRIDRHREIVRQLLDQGSAYHCYCTIEELEEMRAGQLAQGQKPRYEGLCREREGPRAGVQPVVRFKNPLDGAVVVDDLVHGRVVFENAELDDLIIARADGTPTYNLSVVVDDMDMNITHVIRGDDHLNNTPRQINIFTALGVEPPQYAHLSMILGPDGTKLSKRHGAVSVLEFRKEGYLPEALLNYLVRLGWSHGDDEFFTIEDMVRLFDIEDVNKSAAAVNPDKLLWLNQQHIMAATPERLAEELQWQFDQMSIDSSDGPPLADVVRVQQERSKTLQEMARNSTFFYRDIDGYDEKAARKNFKADTGETLGVVRHRLAGLDEWNAGPIHDVINGVADEQGVKLGKVAQPIRVAVSGGSVSPPIDGTLELLGRDKTLERIDRAVDHIDRCGTSEG